MDTILAYLRKLEVNNNKSWFDAHKLFENKEDGVIKVAIENNRT